MNWSRCLCNFQLYGSYIYIYIYVIVYSMTNIHMNHIWYQYLFYISILNWDLCNKWPPSCDPSQYRVSHTMSYILERKLLLRNYDWILMWEEICDWDYFWYNWYIYGGSNNDCGQYDWFHWETENCDINWFDDFKVD